MASSTKTIQEEHSKAKVELYELYLKTYLNILQRASQISSIKIFDLCCGEGVYSDNSEGSPLRLFRAIKEHYYANNQSCIDAQLFINDPGKSDIEKGAKKIDRVKNAAKDIFNPPNVCRTFTDYEYSEALEMTMREIKDLTPQERALVFIDPWGYKLLRPKDVDRLMANGRSEVLLFLPISFMYRFARKSLSDPDFRGGLPLRSFLLELFKDSVPEYHDALSFISALLSKFRQFQHVEFVDKFTIERGSGDYFCLFFFTNHILGLRKMLEAKWKVDSAEGRGFTLPNPQTTLFTGHLHGTYPEELWAYLKEKGEVTNDALLRFGLENGYLPKHSKDILTQEKARFKVEAVDGKPVKGLYIGNKERNVIIKYIE